MPSPISTATAIVEFAVADIDGNGTLDLYACNNRSDDIRDLPRVPMMYVLTNQAELNRMADLIDHTGRLLTLLVRSVAVRSAKRVPRGTQRTPKAEEE